MNFTEHASTIEPGSRLLVVEDHPVFRHGLIQMLKSLSDITICGEAANAPAALEAMRKLQPDLALVDISLPGTNGLELTKLMLAEQPRLKILVVSMHDDSLYALRALRAGAKGYVRKHEEPEQVLAAVRKVLEGGIYVSPHFAEKLIFKAIHGSDNDLGSPVDQLSDREMEVLQLLGKGQSSRDMAEALHLSVKTIETHRAHIKTKLGLKSGNEVVRFAVEWAAMTDG